MKKYLFPVFVFTCLYASAQNPSDIEKKSVLEKVQNFFTALEKQDTVLFKNTVLADGQSWAIRNRNDSLISSWRSFGDKFYKFDNPSQVIQEKMFSAEIKIHQQIAMAWVPYELSISGKFSHCGVDVFTLFKGNDGWRIVNISYTVEPNRCTELKKVQ